ncbi:MAG: hypothetical protein Q8L48_37655 [Archangium sp.]|nr:hypothetical protein [Archangium sp.]
MSEGTLSAGAKALLDAAKRAPSGPSDEAIDRMEAQVLVAVGLSAASGAAGAVAAKGLWSGVLVKVLLGTTLLVVGGVVGAAIVWNRSPGVGEVSAPVSAPPLIPLVVEGPVPAPVAPVPVPDVIPEPTPAPAPAAVKKVREVPPNPVVVRSPVVVAPPSPPPVFPAADELALLRAALQHLDAREWKEALAELDRRDLEFPAGALQDEADVLRVLGLCGLDQVSTATALAARLRVRAPNSPALARLSTSCVNP